MTPKWSPELQATLVRVLATGVGVDEACSIVGLGRRTFFRWCQRGEAGEAPYADFSLAVEQARARVEASVTKTLVDAAVVDGDWRAAASWLVLRRGPRTRVHVLEPTTEGSAVAVTLSDEAADEVRRYILENAKP